MSKSTNPLKLSTTSGVSQTDEGRYKSIGRKTFKGSLPVPIIFRKIICKS